MIDIQDSKTKTGLPNVAVVVFDSSAQKMTTLYTDGYGQLNTNYFLTTLGPSFVGLDYDGYADATFSINYLLGHNALYMRKLVPGEVYTPAATVQQAIAESEAANDSASGMRTLQILGLGALVLLAYDELTHEKKKGVAGFDFKNDIMPYVVPAGIVIAGGLILKKVFDGLGITDSAEDKARQDALDTDIATAGSPTMTASEIAATANALKEDLGYSYVSNNFTDAVHQLTKAANTADILRIIDAYGKHIITFFGIPTGTYTLEETVVRQLPADYIAQVNSYYNTQGINFNF